MSESFVLNDRLADYFTLDGMRSDAVHGKGSPVQGELSPVRTLVTEGLYCCIEETKKLIRYQPFWETLKHSQESTYTLIKNHHLYSSTTDKLRKNKPVTTTTLNDL